MALNSSALPESSVKNIVHCSPGCPASAEVWFSATKNQQTCCAGRNTWHWDASLCISMQCVICQQITLHEPYDADAHVHYTPQNPLLMLVSEGQCSAQFMLSCCCALLELSHLPRTVFRLWPRALRAEQHNHSASYCTTVCYIGESTPLKLWATLPGNGNSRQLWCSKSYLSGK